VEVAVLEEGGRPVGFLPYHRSRMGVGTPIAGLMTDFQGAVTAPEVTWDPAQLVRDCRLKALYFDQLLAAQSPWQPFHGPTTGAPFLEVWGGLEAYKPRRVHAHSDGLKSIGQRARKMERDIGPLRQEHVVTDRHQFQTLIAWKTAQYLRKGICNVLAIPWTVPLLEHLWQLRTPGLSGVLSVLYAGDRVAALHLGMRSRHVLHYWYPVYNEDLARYSPGALQLVRTIAEAEGLGIRHIDLGAGDEPYKRNYMTGEIAVAQAAVDLRPVFGVLRRTWSAVDHYVRCSRLRRPARFLVHKARRLARLPGRLWGRAAACQGEGA
jgi:CelD/BcsL family acetyltransferase involved in cellulose biosynthesis